jgi:ketosteroid isomerase-like protein
MKNGIRWSIVVLLLNCAAGGRAMQIVDVKSELDSLVRSELAFARTAADSGVRGAFLKFLDDSAVVFRPEPVNGKIFYSETPASKARLSWYPVAADISLTADLGYTTGPYEFQSEKASEPVQHGNYVSLWAKEPDGSWKVVLDTGISNPPPPVRPAPWRADSDYKPLSYKTEETRDRAAERKSLMDVDRDFSADSQARRIAAAYADCLAEVARLLRPRTLPLEGTKEIASWLSLRKEAWTWQPMEAAVARGADLGYTYGKMAIRTRAAAAASIQYSYYTRIWKRNRNGAWKLVLDVANAPAQ